VQTVALTGRTTPWAYESLTVVASSPEIEESLERIARRAASHLRRFPEAVAAAGIDRGQLGAAIRALRERQAGQGEEREPGVEKVGEAPLVAGEFDWG
jgi:acyl transferase domain-containing protein